MSSVKDQKENSSRDGSMYDRVDLEKGKAVPERNSESVEEKNHTEGPDDIPAGLERHLSRKSTRGEPFASEVYPLSNLDEGLVGWDNQDDPMNPRNFAYSRKWYILGLVSAMTLLSPLTSSIFAPGISFVNDEFNNTSQILASFSVSVFVLGYCVGPLVLSPLSEIYGRRIVFNGANVLFSAFNLGCALAPNMDALVVLRFFAGIGGSACLTLGAGVVSDLFVAQQRGKAMAMYALGVMFGPIAGPLCGGFIAQRAGWRWDFWVCFIAAVLCTIGMFFYMPETNPAVLLSWKTTRLQKELTRPELRNIITKDKPLIELQSGHILKQGLIRPMRLLFTSPIVFLLSLYVSFIFGLLFLLATTLTGVYIDTYGWSPELCGLAFLGIGLGCALGVLFVARTSDSTIIRLTKLNNGIYEPEMRLPTCVFFGILIPISLFWYGWTTHNGVHWVVPIIGLLPFGFGMMGIFAPIQTYLIDTFPQHAASAIAALTAVRCLFGGLLPLAGPTMYDSLGLGWGNSVLGFVAVAMIPFPALIYKYGATIRKRWPITL